MVLWAVARFSPDRWRLAESRAANGPMRLTPRSPRANHSMKRRRELEFVMQWFDSSRRSAVFCRYVEVSAVERVTSKSLIEEKLWRVQQGPDQILFWGLAGLKDHQAGLQFSGRRLADQHRLIDRPHTWFIPVNLIEGLPEP